MVIFWRNEICTFKQKYELPNQKYRLGVFRDPLKELLAYKRAKESRAYKRQ